VVDEDRSRRPLARSLTAPSPAGRALGALSALAALALCAVIVYAIASSSRAVALVAFLVAAALAAIALGLMRRRATEALERRSEADLAVEMARLLLREGSLEQSLPVASARMAQVLGLSSATIRLESAGADERHTALALRDGGRTLGMLVVPADTPPRRLRRVQERVVPALEALLSAALERERLEGEVVETAALRRADAVKTAVLRSVSHDLRSPLTAISTAAEAVALEGPSAQERGELAGVIIEETRRLARLVQNLLDLSRLEAGAAQPRVEWISIDEVIGAALQELSPREDEFNLMPDPDLPLMRADAAQLERAFVNVLENARRHSGGQTVSVRARASGVREGAGGRVVVRVVDRGPGIAPADLERVFEPFYRAGGPDERHHGSGLGLAIARGFAEANGGTLEVRSLPGQGSTFVFELPVQESHGSGDPGERSLAATTG
jgi:two-component system, OmpR family, sensor histidine kinase KdpD